MSNGFICLVWKVFLKLTWMTALKKQVFPKLLSPRTGTPLLSSVELLEFGDLHTDTFLVAFLSQLRFLTFSLSSSSSVLKETLFGRTSNTSFSVTAMARRRNDNDDNPSNKKQN